MFKKGLAALPALTETKKLVFRTTEQVLPEIRAACEASAGRAEYHLWGASEEGRPLYAAVLGSGPKVVSLLAGAHSDEPVGPETLRAFVLHTLANADAFEDLFSRFRFVVVPHVNPDGEARNQAWIRDWPSEQAYLRHAFREPPGRDIEFGYPDMRPENRLVADFLRKYAPVALHMSLHGMAFSDGLLLLIEKHWADRAESLRQGFQKLADDWELPLHDHDRKGEKGFQYLGPGFTTTPEGQAMRAYFKSLGDCETAALFRDSSMEFGRSLGGDPLCLVTELPLFLIGKQPRRRHPGVPAAYLEFKAAVPGIRTRLAQGEDVTADLAEFKLRALPLDLQVRAQLEILRLGLQCVDSTL